MNSKPVLPTVTEGLGDIVFEDDILVAFVHVVEGGDIICNNLCHPAALQLTRDPAHPAVHPGGGKGTRKARTPLLWGNFVHAPLSVVVDVASLFGCDFRDHPPKRCGSTVGIRDCADG